MDAGGANGVTAASGGGPGSMSTALALVEAPQQRQVAITTTKEIDELHGDEIARRLAEFAKSAPTGMYSKPRGK